MKWWRGLQQSVFDYGIDGWKLDGTATLFYTLKGPVPFFYKTTAKGLMTTRTYMDHYYRDEYHHGRTQNPEFVTLSRAIDQWPHPEGFAPIDAAPVTWVGDQKHTWESTERVMAEDKANADLAMSGIGGIELALDNIMRSAKLGYNIIGSDIAGFSGSEIPPRLYIRWAQFSAFCGLFLNGGHGDRALWNRTPEELEIIRKFSWLHTELIPYIYSYVVTAHQGGRVLQKPVKGKYHYLFGDDFLVAPIYRDQLTKRVTLPPGRWMYFFDDRQVMEGKTTFEREFPLDEFPVFIREGAIVPMQIERDYTGIGNAESKGYLTWLVYPGKDNAFTVYHPDTTGSSSLSMSNGAEFLKLTLRDSKKPSILNIRMEKKPSGITFRGNTLQESLDYTYDSRKGKLVIYVREIADGELIISN